MKLTPSTNKDIDRLSKWIESDPYHKDYLDPYWWITGAEGSWLSFCLEDNEGPLCYVRLDEERDGLIRLHTQFAPREEVTKIRLIKGMLKCVPIVQEFCEWHGSGVIFQSTSSLLIDFMKRKFNFEDVGQTDFVWRAGK
jgi:hypothetical protein